MAQHLVTARIYDKSGQLLSSASNSYQKSHPIQARFAAAVGEPEKIFLHAEIAALVKLEKGSKPYKIVIERFRKDGSAGACRPCAVCQAAIKHWGLTKVEYFL
jgi:tRNA(Arg) A34 adenosine deaminase TadA